MEAHTNACSSRALPAWVPVEARHYIVHTESGKSIRALARDAGCHASTIMRQVHKLEARRDDPLIDKALTRLGNINRSMTSTQPAVTREDQTDMKLDFSDEATAPDEQTVAREARRILRRMSEPGACLAVAQDMEKAVVVRDLPDGRANRTAVVDRPVAEAMALKEWIACAKPGRVARYHITQTGRSALRRLLASDESARAGFAEAPANFDGPREAANDDNEIDGRGARGRYNVTESPVQALARRRDRDGAPFLDADLVYAAERLREDFELAQMNLTKPVNWDRIAASGRRVEPGSLGTGGAGAARERVARVLADLGPGLGDVVLRCCCMMEGMETAEKRMGWSARSGKIVLRIALQRLKKHFDDHGHHDLIG